MESAYFIVLLAAVASFGLGMLTTRNWIAVGLPAVAPMAFTVVRMSLAPNPGMEKPSSSCRHSLLVALSCTRSFAIGWLRRAEVFAQVLAVPSRQTRSTQYEAVTAG